jgi:SAM-dependent methyltransferase
MSSKHGLLTWQDVETARLRPVVLDTLNAMVVAGRQPGQIRVLDLGCGRGITVIKLLQLGFDAYGVDIDAEPVRNGLPLLEGLGAPIAPGDRLRIYAATEPLPFPDTFFDLILSDQVFEHVARLSDVAAEMARVARADACGAHLFPAKWRIMEPHVFVPFVHWLPKTRLRYWWLRVWSHRLPLWRGHDGMAMDERLRTFQAYLNDKTFYRPISQIISTLRAAGFECNVSYQRVSPPVARRAVFRLVANMRSKLRCWWRTRFQEVVDERRL